MEESMADVIARKYKEAGGFDVRDLLEGFIASLMEEPAMAVVGKRKQDVIDAFRDRIDLEEMEALLRNVVHYTMPLAFQRAVVRVFTEDWCAPAFVFKQWETACRITARKYTADTTEKVIEDVIGIKAADLRTTATADLNEKMDQLKRTQLECAKDHAAMDAKEDELMAEMKSILAEMK
jgi:hypothetical protein